MTINKTPLHYLSLLEVADLIRTKQLSPVEVTKNIFSRISTLDSRLQSFTYLMEETALSSAKLAEKEIQAGRYLGPLHGIPIGVKDLCYTQGIPTRGGLQVLKDFVPDDDATVISKLKSAGAVIVGKLSLTEGAVGGYHPSFPLPKNPWGQDLWPGGSSSGSGIATAAGLCYASLGSDTGGSIRFPAMACGIVGLKPTYGLVSRYGILPLAESMDHVGPMARSVADTAVMLQTIAGQDPKDPTTRQVKALDLLTDLKGGIDGVSIGFDLDYASAHTDQELINDLLSAIEQLKLLGARIVPVSVPDVSNLRKHWQIICTYEAAKAHHKNYPSKAEQYGEFFRDFLELGAGIDDHTYAEAMAERHEFSQKFRSLLDTVDTLICPGGGVPFSIPEDLMYGSMKQIRDYMNPYTYFQFTIPANFSGVPTLSLPCGISRKGLLHTMQLVSDELQESLLCKIGYAYQQATNWHNHHPKL